MYILDTNICVFSIKKKSQRLLDKISENLDKGIYISSLSVAELEFGVSNSQFPERNRISLLEFLSIFTILDFKESDAVPYGMIKTTLHRSGRIIGPIDLLFPSASNDWSQNPERSLRPHPRQTGGRTRPSNG